MQGLSWLMACLLLQGLSGTSAQTVTSPACYQSDDQIRNPFASMFGEAVINCLSVTPSGSVDKVILSAFNRSSNATARFTLTCVGSVLVSLPSSLSASPSSIGRACSAQCVDAVQPCSAREFGCIFGAKAREGAPVVFVIRGEASSIPPCPVAKGKGGTWSYGHLP